MSPNDALLFRRAVVWFYASSPRCHMCFGCLRACLVGVAVSYGVAAAFPSTASAQTDTASLRGSVADPTGAAVPNAVVRLTDVDRGLETAVTTGDGGRYSFATVRPGRYEIEVEKSGFSLLRLTGITVN